jgi:hypothetical protein
MKFHVNHPLGAELFMRTDGQTDMKLVVPIRNFTKVPEIMLKQTH